MAKYRVTVEKALELWECLLSMTFENGTKVKLHAKPQRMDFTVGEHWQDLPYFANSDELCTIELKSFSEEIRHLQRLQRLIDRFEEENVISE